MRPFLIWRDDWLLGYKILDEQHLKLAEGLNDLHSYLILCKNKQHSGMDKLSHRLAHLFEMTQHHFKSEEMMMQAQDYHGWHEHHREHVLLLAELRECIREIESGNKTFSIETLKALKYWLIDHVLNSDQLFADYLDDSNANEAIIK